MDKFGVPKKVNRRVIKAIYEELEEPNLSNICNFVILHTKNNVPVAFLRNVVSQSLKNFHELGLIEKRGTNYYRKENVDSIPAIPSKPINKNVFKRTIRKENESNLNPNKRRATLSEDSIPENEPESSLKRLRTSKTLSRKGHTVYLPKAQTRTSNNHDTLNYDNVDMDQGSDPGSDSERNAEAEEDKTTFSSRIDLASQTNDPVALEENKNELYQKINNPLKSNENIHTVNDSQAQTNQLIKYDIDSVHVRVKKLDVLNKNESQLVEQLEDPINSECQQIPDIVESQHSNAKMSQENVNDGFSVQSRFKSNEKPTISECNETKNEEQTELTVSNNDLKIQNDVNMTTDPEKSDEENIGKTEE